jgi:DNA-binding NarL/FixJ family response regulator
MGDSRLRLREVAVGLWGRHELYLVSLAALLSDRGADVRLLDDPIAIAEVPADRIGVLLLESPLPSELARAIGAGPPVIVLEERAEPDQVRYAESLGARAVLEKNASLAELLRAIDDALEQPASEPPAGELTERQREVLRLIAEGLDNAQIAARLGISQRTARAHVSGVLERLGVENRTQAAVTAVRRGWYG